MCLEIEMQLRRIKLRQETEIQAIENTKGM